jgi:hypothetical protein
LLGAFVVSGVQCRLAQLVIAAPVWITVAATSAASPTPLIATPLILLIAAKLLRLLPPQLFLLATVTIILIRIPVLGRCDRRNTNDFMSTPSAWVYGNERAVGR